MNKALTQTCRTNRMTLETFGGIVLSLVERLHFFCFVFVLFSGLIACIDFSVLPEIMVNT